MIPRDPGQALAVGADARLHEEVVSARQNAGPLCSLRGHNRQAIDLFGIVMDIGHEIAIRRTDWRGNLAEGGRDGLRGAASQGLSIESASLVHDEIHVAAVD